MSSKKPASSEPSALHEHEPVIRARGVGKSYQIYHRPIDRLKQMLFRGKKNFYEEFWALRGVDFDVYPGETVGIIGRNGAGKSTLLQMVCGTMSPTEGEISVHGRVAALLELGSGFNPEFTGRENVFLNAALLGMSDDETRERYDAIEKFADIGDFIDQPVRMYSSGMHARLAFAVAIHCDPEVLIVDEILAVGDAAFQRKCIERFYQIRDSGCTILFVSHDPYMVKTICRRAIYLEKGQMQAYGEAETVIDRYTADLDRAAAPPTVITAGDALPASQPDSPFRITDVALLNERDEEQDEFQTGEKFKIRMRYRAVGDNFPEKVIFVVNVYRSDTFYVCGTTTLMEGMDPFEAQREGEVVVHFPDCQLLAGEYLFRVAINDHVGLGIFAEAKYICPLRVRDNFRSVGLVNLERQWEVHGKLLPMTKPTPRTNETLARP